MQITNCKLSKIVQKKLLKFFVLQVTARSAADILGIQPNSAILFYRKIRMVISHYLALVAYEVFEGPVELDESYFGGRRKGRRGRGAAGKVVVFGILKRNGRVYTVVVDNAKSDTLMPVIKQKIMPDSIVYTDSLSSYDKLGVSGFIHYRINHSKEFADRDLCKIPFLPTAEIQTRVFSCFLLQSLLILPKSPLNPSWIPDNQASGRLLGGNRHT